jgi:DNA-binding GntR family transcriptional regulator
MAWDSTMGRDTFPPVTTKADYAYSTIRRQILEGSLRPGQTIDQEALAAELGVSTTPIREALRRLESEQLTLSRAHRETVVTPYSRTLLDETYNVRLALDPFAAGLAAENASAEEQAVIRELLDHHPESGDQVLYLHYNRELHRSIYRSAGNSVLARTLDSLWDLSDRYRIGSVQTSSTGSRAHEEHLAITKAVFDRNKKLAQKLMYEHVAESHRHLQDIIAPSE